MNPFTKPSIKGFVIEAALIAGAVFSINAASPTVVLPDRFANSPVIVENSPQFKAIVAHDKKLQAQLAKEQSDWKSYSQSVDQQLRDEAERAAKAEAELAKLKAEKKPWWKGIPFIGILSLAVGFLGNPFSFIITRLVELGLGLVAIVGFIALIRFLWPRLKTWGRSGTGWHLPTRSKDTHKL